jgi:hypothetical protein
MIQSVIHSFYLGFIHQRMSPCSEPHASAFSALVR